MAGERYWIGIILSQETATLPARVGHEREAYLSGQSFHDDPAKELSTFPAVRPSGESDLGLFLRGKEVD
jgi:hypothetical protein